MISILPLMAAAVFADAGTPSDPYAQCSGYLASDPAAALSFAEKWTSWGGGDEAEHCQAMAYLALGKPVFAARILGRLAQGSVEIDSGTAARLFLQSAEAWMAGKRHSEAYAGLWKAYELTPDAVELHMGAATVYATGEHWEGVVLSLTALERHAPLSADALTLRARGHIKLGNKKAAVDDVTAALRIDPMLIDALVLRGDILTDETDQSVDTL